MKRLWRWLWYAAREGRVEPTPVGFPGGSGPLRFVFSNVEKAPQVILWCHDGTVISAVMPTMDDKPNEIDIVTDKLVIAMGTVQSSPEALMEVYRGASKLTMMPISAYSLDVTRTYTYYVRRWRVAWMWIKRLVRKEPDDGDW